MPSPSGTGPRAGPLDRRSWTIFLATLWALGVSPLFAGGVASSVLLREILTPVHLTTTPLASLVLGLSIGLTALRRTWPLALLGDDAGCLAVCS